MKKNISLIAFLGSVLFSGVAFGQEGTAVIPKKDVTLNVKLLPVISLEIHEGQESVDLVYKTAENYSTGVTEVKPGHLKVVSMGGYAVKAIAGGNLVRTAGGEIEAGKINLKVGPGGTEKTLSATEKVTLITSNNRTEPQGTSYDVTYKGTGSNEFKDKYVSGENPTIYSTHITYSVEAI